MNEELESILRRIKKMLALSANNPNEHESAAAAAMAAKLMAKYNISIAQVIADDLSKNDHSVINANMTTWGYKTRTPLWLTSLAIYIAKAFDCETRLKWSDEVNAYRLTMYGYKSDVEVGTYVFTFLMDKIIAMADSNWPKYKHTTRSSALAWKRSYQLGIVSSVEEKINALYAKEDIKVSGGNSLMVLKKDAIVRKFGEFNYGTRSTDDMDHRARNLGELHGSQIELTKVIKNEQEEFQSIEG